MSPSIQIRCRAPDCVQTAYAVVWSLRRCKIVAYSETLKLSNDCATSWPGRRACLRREERCALPLMCVQPGKHLCSCLAFFSYCLFLGAWSSVTFPGTARGLCMKDHFLTERQARPTVCAQSCKPRSERRNHDTVSQTHLDTIARSKSSRIRSSNRCKCLILYKDKESFLIYVGSCTEYCWQLYSCLFLVRYCF